MSQVYDSRILHVSIQCLPEKAYDYIYDLRNFPEWAISFGLSSIEVSGGEGRIDTQEGPTKIRFVEKNKWGVLDHEVTPSSGPIVQVPMRVVANDTGSEVIFTLYRLPGVSDETFLEDASRVEQDLQSLKRVLERQVGV